MITTSFRRTPESSLSKTLSRSEATPGSCPLRGLFVLLDSGLRRNDGFHWDGI